MSEYFELLSVNLTKEIMNIESNKDVIGRIAAVIDEIFYNEYDNRIIDGNYIVGIVWILIALFFLWLIIKAIKRISKLFKGHLKEKTE